ncbi:hypothetical protein WUBG_09568, partial [Wuchereria bancrofti]
YWKRLDILIGTDYFDFMSPNRIHNMVSVFYVLTKVGLIMAKNGYINKSLNYDKDQIKFDITPVRTKLVN